MPVLNKLGHEALHIADRMFVWVLVVFGYAVALTMLNNNSGWSDPVFRIVRDVPEAQYTWAAALMVAVTIYAIGSFLREGRRHRGVIIIFGASACSAWCMALCLAMTRMVYEEPTRITGLWPVVMMFFSFLYAIRAVTYANVFTGQRWRANPHQMWGLTAVILVSVTQIVIGIAPTSVIVELEKPVALQIALINFIAAIVVMFGLHLKNSEIGLSLELYGSISLVGVLAWYVVTVHIREPLSSATIGFMLTEAFLAGTFHRMVQIMALKTARWRDKPALAASIKHDLAPISNVERLHQVREDDYFPVREDDIP